MRGKKSKNLSSVPASAFQSAISLLVFLPVSTSSSARRFFFLKAGKVLSLSSVSIVVLYTIKPGLCQCVFTVIGLNSNQIEKR